MMVKTVRFGERISFDNGRIVICVGELAGKRVSLRIEMLDDVVFDKPPRDDGNKMTLAILNKTM